MGHLQLCLTAVAVATLLGCPDHGEDDDATDDDDAVDPYDWDWAPIALADFTGDGLAEIVIPAWPDFAIVENAYGGWLMDGADEPWPGVDKHPGDRTLWGGIPDPTDVHWDDPRTNVWQGLPAWP
jgi:hypothetical protein